MLEGTLAVRVRAHVHQVPAGGAVIVPGVPRGFSGIRGFYGLFAAGFGGVGALLTWRRPGHLVGWVFAAAGLLAAVSFATVEYGLAASAGHRLPGAGYVGWVELWIWVPFLALITVYLFLLFPDEDRQVNPLSLATEAAR